MPSGLNAYAMIIFKTAWKNVWRNRIRSMVVIASVSIGIFGGVFIVAIMNGAIEDRVDAALNQELGHVQVNAAGFRDNFDIQLLIPNLQEVEARVGAQIGVQATTRRLLLTGMANTATKSTGVQILGVDPEREKEVFQLWESTMEGTGSFFQSESRHMEAYIGHELAKELNIVRFQFMEANMEALQNAAVPASIIRKLEAYSGTRFKSEKAFKRAVKQVLSAKEEKRYGQAIWEAAWSFRQRSKMTLTFLDRDEHQTGAVFRIAGIFDTKNSAYELSQVLVKQEDLAQLTGLGMEEAHQLIIRLDDMNQAPAFSRELEEAFPGLQVMNWKEIQPDLAMMTDMVTKFYAVFMIIILAALAFGIVNTMLMVVLERTKELGMLTAIGMNRQKVFRMIMLESVFLSLVGGVSGMLISQVLISLTARRGINFASYAEGLEAMGVTAHIYPVISGSFFILVTALIVLTGILSAIYPALKALKLNPVEALRTE